MVAQYQIKVPYLRCPSDKASLELSFGYGDRKNVDAGMLRCKEGSSGYQISKGIPILKAPGYLTTTDHMKTLSGHKELEEILVNRFRGDDQELYIANDQIQREFYRMLGKINSPILDVCSGFGICIQDTLMHCAGSEIFAVEYAIMPLRLQKNILRIIRYDNKVHLLCADVFALPFADNTFRYVTAHIGFNATSDPLRAMEETKRIMQPDAHGVTLTLIGEGDDAYLKPPKNSVEGYCGMLKEAGFVVEEVISLSNNHPEAMKEKKTGFLLTKFRKV